MGNKSSSNVNDSLDRQIDELKQDLSVNEESIRRVKQAMRLTLEYEDMKLKIAALLALGKVMLDKPDSFSHNKLRLANQMLEEYDIKLEVLKHSITAIQ